MIPNTDPTIPNTCESQLPTLGRTLAIQSEAERSVELSRAGPAGAMETVTGSALVLRTISLGTAFVSPTGSGGDLTGRNLRMTAGGFEVHWSILPCTRAL